ncbi:hypothetical protein GGR58DRAFT_506123 [Xylaria digitata]|nr:hypothetical protein GGR58DRAFT_506123 [Xylaria digitata]
MAPMQDSEKGFTRARVLRRLEELYTGGFLHEHEYQDVAAKIANASNPGDYVFSLKEHSPSITIPQILLYLRDNDAGRDANWETNFLIIRAYIAEAGQQMATGGVGFSDSQVRAALADAQVLIGVHLTSEKRARDNTPWTSNILRGQTTQKRLLAYPKAFPLPQPNRGKSQYRPVNPSSRVKDNKPLWNTTLKILAPTAAVPRLAEVDNYVESENLFFKIVQEATRRGEEGEINLPKTRFAAETRVYEEFIQAGLKVTSAKAPPRHTNIPEYTEGPENPDGSKGPSFYRRRGWQRAAFQQCLNQFTSHENRVINTPWRRVVLPYEAPAPLPKEVAFVPRLSDPNLIVNKGGDPFAWLYWSSQYTQTVDFLADCQRRRYYNQSSSDFSVSALPINFRGPRIYRGLTAHDQHWLKIGEKLENLEGTLHSAWGAAPRPLLRAILRDINAGRQENTGGPNMGNGQYLSAEDDDDILDRKRYWRRDIRRRLGIDNQEDNTEDDNFKLIDDFEIAWLKYLCEPSRTLEMCDPSKLPVGNLAILFDAKLQSYFNYLELSGTPNDEALYLWGETREDIDHLMRTHEPSSLPTVLAYINGCEESDLKYSGDKDPNPEHPNACYQFSIEEAEFLCLELQALGRCVFFPGRNKKPSKVGRPKYNVHPEDRVMWRYPDLNQFREDNAQYLDGILDHYNATYGKWAVYNGDRPRFSRELEFMLDHAGQDFPPELERIEILEKNPASEEASAKRRAFIQWYLAPEGLCRVSLLEDDLESGQDAPYRDDLASWETVGSYLTKYRQRAKEQHAAKDTYYSGEPYHPQTPERTAQFFRNLAYRMGRTLRHVDGIKERLQYLENDTTTGELKPHLDLCSGLKDPRPEDSIDAQTVPSFIAQRWWQMIPAKDYKLAIEKWNTAVGEGSGDVELLPPDIKDVLARADPDSSFQNPLKGDQDPFAVIREGIINDCFQNRPTMYPGRLSGFKDKQDKEFQGYERPNLFVWATKDQRRYQAQHTRQHFFNMQRWPPSRILPHRLEAIRERKDEVLRRDPSKPDQAYGILTDRLPIGDAKPLYAQPLIDHHHHHGLNTDEWRLFEEFKQPPDSNNLPTFHIHLAQIDHSETYDEIFKNSKMEVKMGTAESELKPHKPKYVPFTRSDNRFAPGPAVFPMGDTLLQKILISHELNNALYPSLPFYKDPLIGLSRLWRRLAGARPPPVPLVPQVSKSTIPRSNPGKRKMPIEFLNGSSTEKKFRSDRSMPLQPGGSGGQFAAATVVVPEQKDETTSSESDPFSQDSTSTHLTTPEATPKKMPMHDPAATATTDNPLRVRPDPEQLDAHAKFQKDFPGSYYETNAILKYTANSGPVALDFSINHQLAKYNLKSSQKELNDILKSEKCRPLWPYIKLKEDNFDVHCLNLLLEAWGENHQVKLQLGLVQSFMFGSPPQEGNAAYLVGSKYHASPDKLVVWVRTTYDANLTRPLNNPYCNHPYNTYKGLSAV